MSSTQMSLCVGDAVAMLGEGGPARRGQVGVLTLIGEAESEAEFLFWEGESGAVEGVLRRIKVPTAMPLKLVGLDQEEVRALWERDK